MALADDTGSRYHARVRTCLLTFPLLALMLAACAKDTPPGDRAAAPAAAAREESSVSLPTTAGAWTRPAAPRRVSEASIFEYMDGGGELYLGYRFDHLDVFQYTAAGRDPILVELYWMGGSDDAFGLLSNDWGGEAIQLTPAPVDQAPAGRDTARFARALYGAGLLRIWSDNLYARVLASRETPESGEQVLMLGRAIVAGRRVTAPPPLLRILPDRAGDVYRMRPDRLWFLRSHLVLNSAYFLSSQNILDLSPAASEAAIATYDGLAAPAAGRNPHRAQLLAVRYQDGVTARRAFDHFLAAYMPEARVPAPAPGKPVEGAQRIEHGWVGYHLGGPLLILAFDATDERAARALVEASTRLAGDAAN